MMKRPFVLAGLVLLGCGTESGAPGSVVASVTVTPSTIVAGQPAVIAITVVNTSSRSINVGVQDCRSLMVRDAHGAVVGPDPFYCLLSDSRRSLEPGATVVVERSWRGERDRGQVPVYLPPGTYALSAAFPSASRTVESEAVPVVIQSGVESK